MKRFWFLAVLAASAGSGLLCGIGQPGAAAGLDPVAYVSSFAGSSEQIAIFWLPLTVSSVPTIVVAPTGLHAVIGLAFDTDGQSLGGQRWHDGCADRI